MTNLLGSKHKDLKWVVVITEDDIPRSIFQCSSLKEVQEKTNCPIATLNRMSAGKYSKKYDHIRLYALTAIKPVESKFATPLNND